MEVETAGAHWLGADWLCSQGIELPLDAGRVALFHGEQPVPYLLVTDTEPHGLLFYAVQDQTRFASWTTYRLEIGGAAGQPLATAPLPDALGAGRQDTAWTTDWIEQDLEYRPQIEAPTPWFWQPAFSGQRLTHTVELPQAVAGPLTVTLRLWGRDRLRVPGDSEPASVRWDGVEIGAWSWEEGAEQSWPAALGGPGEHELVVDLPAPEAGSIEKLWLDGFGLTFLQPLALETPGVTWQAEAGQALVAGAEGARLLDITDPAAPLDLGRVAGEQVPTEPGRRYWLGVPAQAPPPARLRPLTTLDAAALDLANYVIIAPEPVWDALQPLVDHRQGQGLDVARLTPAQVYDAFGDGRPDPEAIRAMVNRLYAGGQLRYLLLVGDGAAQPDGYAGQAGALRVVTAFVPTVHLYETPSDQAMILDQAGWPLVAVGRFPAQTVAEVEVMVNKTLRWEETGLASAILLSDDEADFGQFADDMLAYLPTPAERLDAAQADARARILDRVEREPTWLNYVGHGSLTLWGDEKLLQREDEWAEPATVTIWACLSAYFVHPSQDSMAEVWLRADQGGAVAFLGPTGETYLVQQHPLAETFYQAVQSGQSLGDALLAAWQQAGEAQQDAVRSFLLLGDPALRLTPRP